MPKMACRCGHTFDFTGDPTEDEMRLLRQTFIEKTAEILDEGKLSGDDFFSRCVAAARHVHPCPECGRIYIEVKPRSGMFDVYVKENERELRPRTQEPISE